MESATTSSREAEFEYLFKLLMIGDSGVGKSTLLLSFTSDTFEDLSPTIGVDFKIKHVTLGGKKLKLAIWDTAGQERFRTLTSSYYRGAQGIILVYDVTRRETFTNLSDIWAKEIDLYSTNQDCIKMLVGNKVDKESERTVSKKEGMEFAREYGCLFLECSAKARVNVEQCFEELVLKILETPSLLAEGSAGVKKNIFKQKPAESDASTSGCCYYLFQNLNVKLDQTKNNLSLLYATNNTTKTKHGNIMSTTTQDSDTTTSTTASAAASSEAALEEAPPQPPPAAAAAASEKPEPLMFSKDPNALESGGGISFLTGSRNAKFSYGFSSFKGKRPSMEDYFEANISDVDGQMVAFFGVFDGHGGSRTAEYLKKNLFKNLSSHPDFIKDTKAAIVEVFKQTDVDYLNEEKGYQRDAGSTASTALLLGDRLFVANVGDSRVVGCRAGSAIPLSVDHKPDRSDERQRIEEAGGFIIWAGTWRVGGVLAVSRAFGDKVLKPFVVAEPEIQEEEIDGVDFIIIASDGLWNVISNKDAVALVQDIADAEEASRKLIQEAFARGSSDNITCVVVQFDISE
ncbi:probable protein phosphatase 2C 11 [Prunus avium]|uniref:protein-serine/threonine phosphatase n=1 Tax=Prunus avium TaxID=42229 RepID=A0A6P5SXR2_PRUAV|nr:probable protein phosphatase 2C 11 [Prunus avium]